jgi:flagellar biosynthesis protein FlhA
MAMKPGEKSHDLEGIETMEPSFGLPVVWIDPEHKEEASLQDYTIVDPESVLITHLSEVLTGHAHEILNREDIQELVDNLEESHPTLVEDVIPDKVSIETLQQILESLLEEKIPINDLARIVETCANNINQSDNIATLTENVRKSLRWAICDHFSDSEDNLYALTLDPTLEDEIRRGHQQAEQGPILEPARLRRIGEAISQNVREWNQGEGELVLMVSPELRQAVKELFGPYFADIPVLAYDELCEAVELQTVDIIAGKKMKQEEDSQMEPEGSVS